MNSESYCKTPRSPAERMRLYRRRGRRQGCATGPIEALAASDRHKEGMNAPAYFGP